MKKLITVACAAWVLFALPGVQAGEINDNVANGYYGGDGHNYGDVIGTTMYDISGAKITRTANVLTITISTNFAGHAGADDNIVGAPGIGYGDVFLANAWHPHATADGHYSDDNMLNGTDWEYGLSLDKRYNNQTDNVTGKFTLYNLKGANDKTILNSDSFIKCGGSCVYRNGQAVAVNTAAKIEDAFVVQRDHTTTDVTGTWKVNLDQSIVFTLDMTGTALMNFNSFAMHWGETCQNDVIEGATSVVSAPGGIPLLALGLGAMLLIRRRQAGLSAKA
jgi:hypothetical protein